VGEGVPVNAADVLAEDWQRHYTIDAGWAGTLVAALLAHGEQGVAILPDGTLYLLDNVEVWEQGILNADLVPLSAEPGEQGQGVTIRADGTLVPELPDGHTRIDGQVYRVAQTKWKSDKRGWFLTYIVPLSAEAGDTDG
jgi:hypothetical protein